jgi:hypothetical protein
VLEEAPGRDGTRLADGMAWQVEAAHAALEGTWMPVFPVQCFIDAGWPFLGRPRKFRGVLIESERSPRRHVARRGGLDVAEVRETAMVLAAHLPAYRG